LSKHILAVGKHNANLQEIVFKEYVMAVPFKQVSIADVQSGMTLSDDLLDATGNILLRQGLVLTEATLNSLRRHCIETLAVVCGDADVSDAAASPEHHEQRLATLFRKPDNDDENATGILHLYVRQYRLGESS
jgi:hypothetical protein